MSRALKFACTQCGKCCHGKTNVFVNSAEIEAIAAHLDLPKFEFSKRYTRPQCLGDQESITLKSQIQSNGKLGCVFLKNNKCSIYSERPTQCRTYPYWPQVLVSGIEWNAEASSCEGISRVSPLNSSGKSAIEHASGTTSSSGGSEMEPLHGEALKNLVVTLIHDRGLGPNWTFEEAIEYLEEAQVLNSSLLEDFQSEFRSSHKSRMVYEDANIRVVDTTTPLPASAASTADSTKNQHDTSISSGEQQGSEDEAPATADPAPLLFQVHRRLEFVSSPGISQTEMKLLSPSSSSSSSHSSLLSSAPSELSQQQPQQQQHIDKSVLCFPVHSIIAAACLHYIHIHSTVSQNELSKTDQSDFLPPSLRAADTQPVAVESLLTTNSSSLSMALIGAGGCALPSYLQHSLKKNLASSSSSSLPCFTGSLHIDAIEPDGGVLFAAVNYFDATVEDSDTDAMNPAPVRHHQPSLSAGGCFLSLHHTDGHSYFKSNPQKRFNIIVVDAFEQCDTNTVVGRTDISPTGSSSSSSNGSPNMAAAEFQAPPISFLQPDFQNIFRAAHEAHEGDVGGGGRGAGCSMVVINCFGDALSLSKTLDVFTRTTRTTTRTTTTTSTADPTVPDDENDDNLNTPGRKEATIIKRKHFVVHLGHRSHELEVMNSVMVLFTGVDAHSVDQTYTAVLNKLVDETTNERDVLIDYRAL